MAQIDKYEVIEEIGRGGMGAVYKALHPQFKKYVAIKEIRAELASDPEVQRRFEQEIEVLAQLPPHPNIVTVRDALVWEGKLYIVLDYINGQNLSQLIHTNPLAADRGAVLLDRILSGLEAIHSRGIVHRDLKAGNILIDVDGNAFITDFGIAEFTNQRSNAVVMATPRYSAPELINPRLRGDGTDQQLDIYAAGVLAYEMLLGEARFRESFPEVYNAAKGSEPEKWLRWHLKLDQPVRRLSESNPQISEEFSGIVARMMEKNVGARYRTVKEVRRDLLVMMKKEHQRQTHREVTFDHTIPLDRSHGGVTNLVGPDTAASYEMHSIVIEDSRSPEGPETGWQPRREDPLELVTKDSSALSTNDIRPTTTNDINSTRRQEDVLTPERRPSRVLPIAGAAVLLLAVLGAWLFLKPQSSTLMVQGAPAGSVVYVDDRQYGVTGDDGRLRIADLTAGSKRLRITREGYTEFTATVEAKGGAEQVVFANLEKEASGRSPSSPTEIDYYGTMVLIPGGAFLMGDNEHAADERKAHNVTLPDFYIDKFEVTNAQYRKFCDATNRPYPTVTDFNKRQFESAPNKPVVGVSWQDAADYAQWSGKRLPTEEEWEKAASWEPKTQKKRQFPWGNEPSAERTNVGKTIEALSDVGSFPTGASWYGVMDMAGNASEWVESFYQAYAGNEMADEDFGITQRVIRGGDVLLPMDDARTTSRKHAPPNLREMVDKDKGQFNTAIGFRCAISATDSRLPEGLRRRP